MQNSKMKSVVEFYSGSLQINTLFIELTIDNEKTYLMIDSSGINKNGPGRFRIEANPDKQVCYFN